MATSCNNPEHSSLITTIGEQSRLITRLFDKIQDLERKLDVAREAAHRSPTPPNPVTQAPNFTTPGGSYVDQADHTPAPSAYESRRAQAQGQPCNYGASCTREQCWYDHPNSRPTRTSRQSTTTPNQSQPTGNSTGRTKPCNYGMNCTRKQCWYEHPPGWLPPNSPAQGSRPREDPIPEVPAAEAHAEAQADNWGPSEDLSSWGAAPTNDWGTPVDNTWGAPAVADNGWGATTDNSWSTSGDQHKPSANNSRSASVMSREGSVSNSSTSNSRARRGGRGKGRRADSESIATRSTPMSPAPQSPAPAPMHFEPVPTQTPTSPPADPAEETSSFNEPNNFDEMDTPPLEPVPSSSSEPEAPSTPKAAWSDEPNIDVVYFPDPPSGLDESQPPAHDDKSIPEDQSTAKPVGESLDLDQSAPSDLYSSWGVSGASASDWGLDPTEFPDPTPVVDNKMSGNKSRAKGKQKETFSTGASGRSTPASRSSKNTAAQSGTSTPSANEPDEPEPAPKPAPDPPQGVPHDQIPDWLLGGDEDAHATLGIPRAASPKPEASSAPPRLAPTNPAPRAPLSKLAGENFPTLSGTLPATKSVKPKDETPPKPTFAPRPVRWKITRTSDTGKGGKPKDDSSKSSFF